MYDGIAVSKQLTGGRPPYVKRDMDLEGYEAAAVDDIVR